MMNVRWGFGLAMLAWTTTAASISAQDKVYARKGVPAEGRIVEMAPDRVVLDKNGVKTTYQANEVLKLSFDEEPQELVKSRDSALAGQVEAALVELKQIDPKSLKRDEIRQELEYYKAYCEAKVALGTGGNLKAADEGLFNFVRTNRGSYHTFEATEILGMLAMAQGNWEDATKRFGFLGRAPWADYKLRGAVLEAQALASQKKYAEAAAKYDLIVQTEDGSPEASRQKMLARVGKAVCLAETGKPDAAITAIEDIIKKQDSKDTLLFGRAYNGLGRAYLKQKKQKEALLAFLHVDMLFFADAETHAEALFHLSNLWSAVNKADRAIAARTVLQQQYGGSLWSKAL